MSKAKDSLVAFGEFGTFEVVDPGLQEIVDRAALEAVSGGSNFGCIGVGPINGACHDQFCANIGCIQAGCGNNVSC